MVYVGELCIDVRVIQNNASVVQGDEALKERSGIDSSSDAIIVMPLTAIVPSIRMYGVAFSAGTISGATVFISFSLVRININFLPHTGT